MNFIKESNLKSKIVIMCVGTDKVLFDCFGALVGSLLKNTNINAYVYGQVGKSINSKNIKSVYDIIKVLHPDSYIIVVDCCPATSFHNIGQTKIFDSPCKCVQGKYSIGNACVLCSTFFASQDNIQYANIFQIMRYAVKIKNFLYELIMP